MSETTTTTTTTETTPATVTRTRIEREETSGRSADFILFALLALVFFAMCERGVVRHVRHPAPIHHRIAP